jgi:hypothetical protein
VIDPDVAELYGYHLPPDAASAETERRRSDILEEQPKAERAYFGPEDDKSQGCAAQAGEELARGAEKITDTIAAQLSWQSLDASKKDPAIVSVQQAWKKCMDTRGYSYASPDDALNDKAWDPDGAAVSQRERAVAVADVECKYDVDMPRIWRETETAVQRQMIAANASRLNVLKQAIAAYMKNVRSVLSQSLS